VRTDPVEAQAMKIVIPGIPCGNFASVVRMIAKGGGSAVIASDPGEVGAADKVILAGVGAFDFGMSSLRDGGWIDALNEAALTRRVPVLGICLGMQLLCRSSEEGVLPGLGWIDADVRRFQLDPSLNLKVPHMGWNTVTARPGNPLIDPAADEQRFYFTHSYHAVCDRPVDVLATAHHGDDFVAAVWRDNILGVQFHPEKSHRFGLALMQRFLAIPC
jgi:imidazole glycerol-phosphate synthase subunit HisH